MICFAHAQTIWYMNSAILDLQIAAYGLQLYVFQPATIYTIFFC